MDQTFIRTEADGLLREIGDLQRELGRVNAAAEKEMAAVRERYAGETRLATRRIQALERQLAKLVRGQKAALMGDADRVDLPHGAVIFAIERRLKRVRDMLARLKERGWTACIKVAESVNWGAVEALQAKDLEALGAEWVSKEHFSYEIKDS